MGRLNTRGYHNLIKKKNIKTIFELYDFFPQTLLPFILAFPRHFLYINHLQPASFILSF